MPDTYADLITAIKEISLLSSAASVLHWDEETHMPPKAAEHRANQASLLARMTHEQFTSPKVGEMLAGVEQSDAAKGEPEGDVAVNARELRRSYDRATKIPPKLVEEMSKTAVLAHQAWVEARKKSDFSTFKPWLAKTLDLKRQEAACISPNGNPYDALLDEYEPGETVANLVRVFESLRGPLIDLVGRITSSGKRAPIEILERIYP